MLLFCILNFLFKVKEIPLPAVLAGLFERCKPCIYEHKYLDPYLEAADRWWPSWCASPEMICSMRRIPLMWRFVLELSGRFQLQGGDRSRRLGQRITEFSMFLALIGAGVWGRCVVAAPVLGHRERCSFEWLLGWLRPSRDAKATVKPVTKGNSVVLAWLLQHFTTS